MSIALDFGNTRVRSLRRQSYRLIGRSCRSAYAAVANTPAHRNVLGRLRVTYLAADDLLIVAGDEADDVAELFRIPATPLLSGEPAIRSAPAARQVVTSLLETLLPEPADSGPICCFTRSGPDADDAHGWYAEQEFLAQAIRLRGYRPLAMGSAAAVVLAELGNKSLTGIGISLGSARCEVALVAHGVELARTVVGRGGDWIDEELAHHQAETIWDHAGNQHLDLRSARRWKESNAGSLRNPATDQERQLAAAYRELARGVTGAVSDALDRAPRAFAGREPVPIMLAGGTASHPGFREVFLASLRGNPLPIDVGRVQVIGAWEYSVARGCLIRAALEEATLHQRAA